MIAAKNAGIYQGLCECHSGFEGDPYEICDPRQSWKITDGCDDDLDIEWRLTSFDSEWVWPESPSVFVTPGFTLDDEEVIRCREGELICFGAQAGERSWGVGLDGNEECDDCCFECEVGSVDAGILTCK